jgi:hypothetical protein
MTATTHYLFTRHELTRMLSMIAETPELLGHPHTSSQLDLTIAHYRAALTGLHMPSTHHDNSLHDPDAHPPARSVEVIDPLEGIDDLTLERLTAPDQPPTVANPVHVEVFSPPETAEEKEVCKEPEERAVEHIELLALHGARVLCVGGSKTAHQMAQFNQWFAPASFKWVCSEKRKGVRQVQRVCKKIKSGKYDVVCLMLRSMSHAETDMLIRASKKAQHKVHVIRLESGFGLTAWLDAIRRASPPLLHKLG